MECPICQQPDLTEDTVTCPKCNSDLESFTHLTHLDKQVKKKTQIMVALASALLFSIIIAGVLFFKTREKTAFILTQNTQIDSLKIEIESLENDNISLATPSEKEQVQTKPAAEIKASSPASVTSGETIYVVKKNESLSMIAQKILGDASKYVQIAKDNNIDNPDIIEEGTELKINH